ncbi:hypothetical protein [Nocardioides ferulae]|uniref:hypothetical protein n=1 Tax=Nocardioides ferulae TaxID=2340821 RepID=UPI000EABC736|nr:hypothetical protein [Nocardioides ferulae]
MTSLTRGPLPASVYWRRRLIVFGGPLALVIVLAQVLGGSSDGSSSDPGSATVVAADATGSGATESPSATPTQKKARKPGRRKSKEPEPVLAEPEGRCSGADISVTPEVDGAVAGRDVALTLGLRTLESPACLWKVSPDNLTLKITSGPDFVWSSQQCRRAVPRREVVVRNNATTPVEIVWEEAKRSDDDCSGLAGWAMPGWYHAIAAALGGEPTDVQFELETPPAPQVTKTAKPKNG